MSSIVHKLHTGVIAALFLSALFYLGHGSNENDRKAPSLLGMYASSAMSNYRP
ncbi:MAG: hypothetical protein HOM11_13385 [Methylococcales bacterium]|nr:hypothetical protein [Methylococcales bacterium]MBT7445193.1 hypothetical protein [Methylococcales bacterium]